MLLPGQLGGVGALVNGFVRSMITVSAVIFLVSGDTDMATGVRVIGARAAEGAP